MKKIAGLLLLIAVTACANPVALPDDGHTAGSGNHTAGSGNHTAGSGNHTAGSGN